MIESQPFLDKGIELEWTDESRGSGQMNLALRNDETDVALVLTESFLKDFELGNPSKMIGFHVQSPLIWGIHIHAENSVNSLSEVNEHSFLISRMGSGSHLMAYVLGKQENWNPADFNFKVVGNLPGALAEMTPEKTELFLWEKFTTKPWVDSGKFKRIGEVLSPWPCFAIIASENALTEFGDLLFELRDLVYKTSAMLQRSTSSIDEISTKYELEKEDVREWLNQTTWATDNKISRSNFSSWIAEMKSLGIVKKSIAPEEFLTAESLSIMD